MLFQNTKPSCCGPHSQSVRVFRKIRLAATMCFLAIALAMGVSQAKAQTLEFSGGYSHVTGDFGVDGFSVGTAWHFDDRLGLAFNYDDLYDTSRVGTFEFTSVGAIASKSHLQEFLIGPRYYFSPQTIRKHTVNPFVEAQFGETHLNSKVAEGTLPTIENAATAFSWMLGGGVDYQLESHWAARANLGFLRTHLNDSGQSRLRFVLGVVYTIGGS